ncbi:MAG TPA: carbohydrate kinase family protein [Marinobacter sp.]|jgi:sugar/nucleoside kinase (ribokinase family)|nr:carbohydrate kinase family protein [Marinobacter sp.]
MPAKPHTVLVLGGASLDTIVHLDSLPAPVPQTIWPKRAYRTLGSTGAGKALNLAALGHEVVLHTLLGDDPEAEAIRQQLAHPRIRLLVETTDAATEQHVNLMTEQGERISLFVQPPAAPESVDWRPVEAALANAQVLVANILSYVKPALPMLKATGKPLWTDLHDYDGQNPYHQPFIDAADVVFLSSDNLPDYRHTLWALIEQGKAFVVCTHGKDGATLLTRDGQWLEQPAIAVPQVVDTNGAGDAFFSGFLSGYLAGEPLARCLELAAECGARCVTSDRLVAAAPV